MWKERRGKGRKGQECVRAGERAEKDRDGQVRTRKGRWRGNCKKVKERERKDIGKGKKGDEWARKGMKGEGSSGKGRNGQ